VDNELEDQGALTHDQVNDLILEHRGWAESIARSVARSWNMDWRLDGLDGAAMEALIFCARRFNPERGVPFKGYARRRIHEASTEAARRSRGWRRGSGSSAEEQKAREVSAELLNIFPELRVGEIPFFEEGGGEGDMRSAIRHLLVGATLLSSREGGTSPATPDQLLDYKKLVKVMSTLEPVHQALLWKVYWEGLSLRTVASEWGTDGLNVIREHKILIAHLHKCLATSKQNVARPKVRPGLRPMATELKRGNDPGPFSKLSLMSNG
jgi:RNA polymerase sigma factor (sigma-70 family)